MERNKKEIVALSDYEHVRLRSTMYVGSIDPSDEKIPIIKDGKIYEETKTVSVGFYKLLNEILDNSIDEAKRMNGKMKFIKIRIDSKNNKVSVEDSGKGFYKGIDTNKKTELNNIETAMIKLRAGSNFYNDEIDESLIGTNGVGAALVNMLSSYFSIETRGNNYHYKKTWKNFKASSDIIKKGKQNKTGTKVKFIPDSKIFKKSIWDKDVIECLMTLKHNIIKLDPLLKKLRLEVKFDGEKLNLKQNIFPEEFHKIDTPIGNLFTWESFEGSLSLSFVNSALCTGVHQKIINDYINNKFDDPLAHHFYETLLILNLPPKLVRFGDQNKTKFVSTRLEIEETILDNFSSKINSFFRSDLFKNIKEKVEERKKIGEIRKLRSLKRKQRIQNSNKYFPSAGKNENLFIVEGMSAMGSILQKRNTRTDAVYSLKGKIKNARSVGDLSGNKEIIDLMQILDLDVEKKGRCTFDRVIISTDADPDGYHICSLLVNLFYRWFSHIISEGKLYILRTPLVSVGDGKNRKYYFSLEQFSQNHRTTRGVRYLKGLGSLSIEDWEWVMGNKTLQQIKEDKNSKNFIDIAFGPSSQARKKWLKGSV